MESYKILYQYKAHKNSLKLLSEKKNSIIFGNNERSFAIKFNPQKFNNFINNNFLKFHIRQTIITDQKLAFLIVNSKRMNLKFINCELSNGEEKEAILDENNNVSVYLLTKIVEKNTNSINNITLFSNEHNRIRISKSGIINFTKDEKILKKIIDIINLGKEALNNEKNI